MTNINLTTREENIEADSMVKEWSVFLLVIVIVGIIYLGFSSYSRWLSRNLEEKNTAYKTKYNALLEKGKSVFDFQNRLNVAKTLVVKKNYVLEIMGQIEKAIIPEVYLESFDFLAEEGQINLTFVAKQYRLVANQIASLRKLDYFSDIEVSETRTLDDGKVSFPLKLKIKDNQIKK